MNSLSWLIYFASLSGSASSFLCFLAFIGAALLVVGTILSVLWTDGNGSYLAEGQRDRKIKGYEEMRQRGRSLVSRGFLMLLVFGGLATVLPSSNAVYAIAASEIGERVITDETVKGIAADSTKALQAWIKRQIEPEAKKQ